MEPISTSRLAFGEFVFDAASGDLQRNGSATRLAPQVAAVLRMLVARPGDVVTRAELRDALWPNTTVEFDQGLNFCIRQLRVALSDDAGEPKYIETLHRRGYRFVAAVSIADSGVAKAPDPSRDSRIASPPAVQRRRPAMLPIALAGVAVALAVIALMAVPRSTAALRVAILRFDVPAGDTALADYRARLVELLITSVGKGRLNDIAVMGPSFTMKFGGSTTPPDSIRDAIGATHVLSGALRLKGDSLLVFAQLIRTSDRRHLWAARFFDATRGSQIITIADSIARAATTLVLRDHL